MWVAGVRGEGKMRWRYSVALSWGREFRVKTACGGVDGGR